MAHLPARAARSRPRVGRQQAHPLTLFRSRGGHRSAAERTAKSPPPPAGKRAFLRLPVGSGTCRGFRAEAKPVSSSEGKRVLLPLPGPGSGICRGVPAKAASVSSTEPGNVFAATSERKRNLFRFPRAAVAVSSGPEADGLLRRRVLRRKALFCACYAESRGCPPFERSGECSAPFRAGTWNAGGRACRYGTRSALPFSGPGRALHPPDRGADCLPLRRLPRFCRVFPKAGDQSAEASPFCASSDACEGRSVKMISAWESSSRISSSTPGSTITPERGFLMLSTRVVMTA